jgi:DNA-binding IclR family transcriptional regulator
MNSKIRYRAPALEKGLEIFELLGGVGKPLSTLEISTHLGRSIGEIYRILQVLEEARYIAQGESGFRLTDRLFTLSMGHPPIRDLVNAALPVMRKTARVTGQSCHLAICSGAEMVVVAGVEAPGLAGFAVRIGYRRPLHRSASGRVLLAFQSANGRQTMLNEVRRAGETIDDTTLMVDFKAIIAAGGSMTPSPVVAGIIDVSAPICVANLARGALTMPFVDGPATLVNSASAREAVQSAAHEIAKRLTC